MKSLNLPQSAGYLLRSVNKTYKDKLKCSCLKTVTGKIKKMKEDDLQANQANVQLQGIYIYTI